jgi:hypothetical protein
MNKKAQEEMVGFILIVVLVIVIAVILLGISIRTSDNKELQKSDEITSFLASVSEVTTDCQIPETRYRNIGELILDCNSFNVCSDGEETCEILENELEGILNHSTFVVKDSGKVVYYNLDIINEDQNRELISINESASNVGSCSKFYDRKGFHSSDGSLIYMNLEVCYKN